MRKLSKEAFAIMAICKETKKPFGITVDPQNGCLSLVWSFKISENQAKREGYDKAKIRGSVLYDAEFNGCPYCGTKQLYYCNNCKKMVCYHGEEIVTCPNCGNTSRLQQMESFELSGGGY
jgi:predicted RNA-binding Zn-ribbon protein involved in translation (DUF1610 family)